MANANTQSVLNHLIVTYKLTFVAIIEPLNLPRPEICRLVQLEFKGSNSNNKIWIFAERSWSIETLLDSDQVMHVRVTTETLKNQFFVSAIYGKCSRRGRLSLWESLRDIADTMEGEPWIVGGDFNIYLNEQERRGGTAEISQGKTGEMLDFVEAINDCHLVDPGFDGSLFSWARGDLFERLDRVLINEGWSIGFAITRVTVLPRVVSDHGPLLVRCLETETRMRAPFRFQNMCTRHHQFMEEVRKLWSEETEAHGMRNLHLKLNNVKKGLKRWNKEVFGNIFVRLRNAEARAAETQQMFEEVPSPANREQQNRCAAEYLLCLRMEEDFWRQKANSRWVIEGERNTKVYQGWVRQKRVKSRIHEITVDGNPITTEEEIRQSAVNFFQNLLSSDVGMMEEPDLDIIQPLPADLDIVNLCDTPTMEEIKQAVFSISANSASGPDGFSSLFFQSCWEIVGTDVAAAVRDFFAGRIHA